MIQSPCTIAIIMPRGEIYGPERPGAVSLVVHDMVRTSAFRDTTYIFGSPAFPPFPQGHFETIHEPWIPFIRKSLRYAFQVGQQLQKLKPQIIELHNRPTYFPLLHWMLPKTQFTLHLHNDPRTVRGLKSYKQRQKFLKKVSAIYCVSDFVKKCYLDHNVQDPDGKIHVLPIGMDPIPAGPKDPLILFVGRIIPEKGALLFAQAITQALPHLPEKWRVGMIGAKRFGQKTSISSYEKQVEKLLNTLGDRVIYYGYVPFEETLKKICQAEIMVTPSQWEEPFGRTALEAMAGGAALLSTSHGGLKEVIGDAALDITHMNATDLAQELIKLTHHNNIRYQLQEKGRQRAETLFRLGVFSARQDSIRETILGMKPA